MKTHPFSVIRVEQMVCIKDIWLVVERKTVKRGLENGCGRILDGYNSKKPAIAMMKKIKALNHI